MRFNSDGFGLSDAYLEIDSEMKGTDSRKRPSVDLESLHRVFTVPEDAQSTLSQIEQQISENLDGFLQEHVVAIERPLVEVEQDFQAFEFPESPIYVSEQASFLLNKVVAHSVHTSSPSFIGHMTSALPYFMLPLSKILMGLNQNLVKIETSRAFTPLERQVIGMLHHLVYQNEDAFYERWMHDAVSALGAFCSGGTIANLTALWVARNKAFPAEEGFSGVDRAGLFRACRHYECEGAAVLVSERGHYSLGKSVDLLGLGREDLIAVETDQYGKIRLDALELKIKELQSKKIKIIAMVGVAGSSETGSIDPLDKMADLAEKYNCYFHVDAAWGGPTLCSQQYRHLLSGISRADSATIDAHKQFYVPMGSGMVVFKDPSALGSIEHHAEYIIRKGSKDLGSHTLEGSRAGNALLVHSGFRVIGRKGYELLINMGIELARQFALLIDQAEDFELISAPELNILTYRYVPKSLQSVLQNADEKASNEINTKLNKITRLIQKTQRGYGRSFVSRTQFKVAKYFEQNIVVFRVVLANPMTTEAVCREVLDQQRSIAQEPQVQELFAALGNGSESV